MGKVPGRGPAPKWPPPRFPRRITDAEISAFMEKGVVPGTLHTRNGVTSWRSVPGPLTGDPYRVSAGKPPPPPVMRSTPPEQGFALTHRHWLWWRKRHCTICNPEMTSDELSRLEHELLDTPVEQWVTDAETIFDMQQEWDKHPDNPGRKPPPPPRDRGERSWH